MALAMDDQPSPSRRSFVTTSLAGVAGLYATRALGAREWTDTGVQSQLAAEDGYRLWLRYAPPGPTAAAYRSAIRQVIVEGSSPTAKVIRAEVTDALSRLLGAKIPDTTALADGAVVIGTPESSPAIRGLGWQRELAKAGPEGYVIRSARVANHPVDRHRVGGRDRRSTARSTSCGCCRPAQPHRPRSTSPSGRRCSCGCSITGTTSTASIERGYAGRSLWQWNELPGTISPRYVGLRARECVDRHQRRGRSTTSTPTSRILSPEYLREGRGARDVWRPYGVRMYLSANFAAPIRLGGLKTADPLDPGVAAWWKAKADEIYKLIPDFGGFLVKANSEGQPGPKDYGRTHAEGANVLADALAPHGGNVIWRAFIYDEDVDPDRAKRAYIEFTRLDGQFRPNVLVQVKNGAIDFMPREPFHPLFGALKKTPVLAEIQATQEYLGQAKHLVYLGHDVGGVPRRGHLREGQGIDGRQGARRRDPSVPRHRAWSRSSIPDSIATGAAITSRSRTGTRRAAWRGIPSSPPKQIADEWTRMTFTNDAEDASQTIRDDDDGVARDVRELHDAARPASPDRRQPLRADAARTPRRRARTGRPSTTTRRRPKASASIAR